MFILILFGYKQSRIFTLECLTSTLMDCIWQQCTKEVQKLCATREEMHIKEIQNLQKKIITNDKRLEILEKQIQDEQNKDDPTQQQQQQQQSIKKDEKKVAKVVVGAGKKGKDIIQITNPLEIERNDLQKDNEKSKESIQKYEEKLTKLNDQREKFKLIYERIQNGQFTLELCDKSGERKFVKTKLTQDASSFLSDKNSYVLGYLAPGTQVEEEEQMEAIQLDGFCVRTLEEDIGAVDEPLIQLKKEEKKKGKKK